MRDGRVKVPIVVKKRRLSELIAEDIAEPVQCTHGAIARTGSLGRACRRDDEAEAKELPDIAHEDRVNAIALPGEHRHKVFLFKAKQGVPNGRPADTILFSKDLLPQFLR